MPHLRSASSSQGLRRWARVTLTMAAIAAVVMTQLGAPATAATTGGHRPVGHFDSVVQSGVGFHLTGWAYDPDTSAAARVRVYVDGKRVATTRANLYRPDVVLVHPSLSSYLGFALTHTATAGTHKVCVTVVNYPTKKAVHVKCRSVTIAVNPIGAITSFTHPTGFVHASGWAIDPDVPTHASTVSLRIDGKRVTGATANKPVAGLAAKHPAAGADHGFALSAPITQGVHSVCVRITNYGAGATTTLPCHQVSINYSPTGQLTKVTQIPGGVTVTGYASDPDTTAPIDVTITAGGTVLGTVLADGANKTRPGHGFHASYLLPGAKLARGKRTICAIGINAGTYGANRSVQCVAHTFNWNPTVGVESVVQKSPGATIVGWATDPDTSAPINVNIVVAGQTLATVLARKSGHHHGGHRFTATVSLPDGTHSVCAVGVNTLYGSGNSTAVCKSVTLNFRPYGAFQSVARAANSTNVVATGWTIDPDTTAPIDVLVSVDGGTAVTSLANIPSPAVTKKHPGTGTAHGFAVSIPASVGEHKVCVQAVNVLGGSGNTSLGCRIIDAVHPTVPTAPTAVGAVAGYGGARIVWVAPSSDGGAPWSGYTITAAPGGKTMTVPATINATTLLGLKAHTTYTFSVVANNVAGVSASATSPAVTTQKQPPAQTSPAPISTSRYIRNVHGASSTDLALMRKEGATDAKNNPSGHGYLILLDIGGQVEADHGVILSGGIRYVSYTNLVADLQAYVGGYASQQRPSAPITIALGTNNDIDVSRSSGTHWATKVVAPVLAYAARYPGITIAGADDIEPGFRASYTSTKHWLQGYLKATTAPFVFNGSADGCAWTMTNRGCNNGWTMRELFYLAGGANAIRILGLPQIYNSTMARQWRYISLTGVYADQPRIDFGGALTEYTACHQAGSCGSLTGTSAWKLLWAQLRAVPQLKPNSLPYSTDLRIDS